MLFNIGKRPGFISAIATINKKQIIVCCVKASSLSYKILNENNSLSLLKLCQVVFQEIFCTNLHSTNVTKIIDHIENRKIDTSIIGGDFNTIPLSNSIRLLTKEYNDSFKNSIKYFLGTRIKYFLKPRIDYIFLSKNFNVIKKEVIYKTYGDHYPVKAELLLKKIQSRPQNEKI